jgi:hypothetical protein
MDPGFLHIHKALSLEPRDPCRPLQGKAKAYFSLLYS